MQNNLSFSFYFHSFKGISKNSKRIVIASRSLAKQSRFFFLIERLLRSLRSLAMTTMFLEMPLSELL